MEQNGVDLHSEPRLCSVDIFEIAPIEGAHRVQGDITRQKTVEEIQAVFGGKQVDMVVSDGAPDILGEHDFDQFVQH